MENQDELAKFKTEFEKLLKKKETVWIEVDPISAWSVMVAVQLASRHPKFNGNISELAKAVAQQLQSALFDEGVLAEVAQKGWNSDCDRARYDAL